MARWIDRFSGFDWDKGNWPKCGKHGVSREEIEELFSLEPAIHPDTAHSERETRFLAIGKTAAGRWVFAAFTIRQSGRKRKLRPISARYMHAKEIRHYENREKGEDDSGSENG